MQLWADAETEEVAGREGGGERAVNTDWAGLGTKTGWFYLKIFLDNIPVCCEISPMAPHGKCEGK